MIFALVYKTLDYKTLIPCNVFAFCLFIRHSQIVRELVFAIHLSI